MNAAIYSYKIGAVAARVLLVAAALIFLYALLRRKTLLVIIALGVLVINFLGLRILNSALKTDIEKSCPD